MLSESQRAGTVATLMRAQLPNGCMPWFEGGRWDPWDHVEAAMALDAGGAHGEAFAAYEFLASEQRHDGAWACPIVGGDRWTRVLDSNGAAYIAVGVHHHFLLTSDEGALHKLWPVVERGVEFALDLQMPSGAIAWSRDLSGEPGDHALLTGCSCLVMSIGSGIELARALGDERPDWELARDALTRAVAGEGADFADRSRYSMDWYYPILGGVLTGDAARARIEEGWDRYVVEGLGVRCVDDRPWVTSAETAETAMALVRCGMVDEAEALFEWVQYQRHDDGSYWTGATFPDGRHFPNERTTWSAAAIVLANDVITRRGVAAEIFASETAASSVPQMPAPP
ncbi:MAG TPA: prenyltransferase [Actinomycetota bacterium]|nr:prenyltransferase [Actinomycetota bacterium]